MGSTAPVEYAVAVDLYLDQAPISGASRRVYRISLASWARPLVMSYRRAAEMFPALTRPLDAAGRGWTLHQLSAAGRHGGSTR